MLLEYPTKFNSEPILRPTKWELTYDVIENVNQTEAGTDVVNVIRKDKLSISASYKCSSIWAKKFQQYNNLSGSITVSIYDPYTDGYKDYTMRMRNFKMNLKPKSEFVRYGNGIYEVSFKLIEY